MDVRSSRPRDSGFRGSLKELETEYLLFMDRTFLFTCSPGCMCCQRWGERGREKTERMTDKQTEREREKDKSERQGEINKEERVRENLVFAAGCSCSSAAGRETERERGLCVSVCVLVCDCVCVCLFVFDLSHAQGEKFWNENCQKSTTHCCWTVLLDLNALFLGVVVSAVLLEPQRQNCDQDPSVPLPASTFYILSSSVRALGSQA